MKKLVALMLALAMLTGCALASAVNPWSCVAAVDSANTSKTEGVAANTVTLTEEGAEALADELDHFVGDVAAEDMTSALVVELVVDDGVEATVVELDLPGLGNKEVHRVIAALPNEFIGYTYVELPPECYSIEGDVLTVNALSGEKWPSGTKFIIL